MKRNEVPEELTWNLSDIFETDEVWEEELKEMKEVPAKLVSFEGRLGESAGILLDFFRLSDELEVRLSKLCGYASQKGDEDTANGKYQDMRGRATSCAVAISAAASFADVEIMHIPSESLDSWYEEEPQLAIYKINIDRIKRAAEHILSSKEEAILASASEMASSAENISSTLLDADLKWDDVEGPDGEKLALTSADLTSFLENPDRAFRERVFRSYYARLGAFKNTFAAALDGQFKQLKFYANARKYKSTLDAALDSTEVPTAVYTNLISAVHEKLEPMYRYVRLRKKLLGVDELHMYDIYTPIVKNVQKKYSYEEAKEMVLEALSVLGEDYTDIIKEGFSSRWVDVCANEGKRGGAYSSGNARPHPYVLLNYKENLDSVFTIAHEMGHALHSYHSEKYQPVNTSDYVIFVAEVASTCNEILLMKHLLGKTEDPLEKAYLINHFLDSFKGTLYRQTMFAEFELMMGRMAENGETLTADVLNEKYLEINKLYYGPDMVSDDEIALEWSRIPHFFYDYYVFQYATGFSAAAAIANRILTEGKPAVEDYKKFLSSGCSSDPVSLLKIAGVDMSSPEPVISALGMFEELVEELENLSDTLCAPKTRSFLKEAAECPVCGSRVFDEAGKYEICPVCGWEDDPVQRRDPGFEGGANEMSLEQARESYKNGGKVK